MSSFPDGRWYFNPFSWQLLFVLGARFALGREANARHSFPSGISILRIAALLYLLFALVVTVAGNLPQLAGVVPDPVLNLFLPNEKENLAPYRVLHFLALAFLFSFVVPRDWRGFQSPVLQPVIKCGEEWLPVFCIGVFLSFAGHFVLITGPNLLAMHILVSIAGIAIMAAVAYYVSWSNGRTTSPRSARDKAASSISATPGPLRHRSRAAGSISRAKIPAECKTSCWVRLPNENWLMK